MDSKISLSQIKLSSNDSWGPDPSYVFEQYRNLPFAPFNKLEKIGKFCDISNPLGKPTTTSTTASTVPVDEEEEFKIVETRVLQKGSKQQAPKKKPQVAPTQGRQPAATTVYQNKLYKMPTKQHRPNYHPRIQVTRTKFKDNAGVQADWIYLMDANKTNFDKTPVSSTKFIDLGTAGAIPEYDRTWDGRPNPKRNVPFTLPNTLAFGTGPRNDRFIMDLAENERGTEDITIYTTDIILSALLTVKNSVFPWDLTVIKEGNQIFIEPSEKNKANYVDILTVNENTASDLPEDEKEMLRLCIESTNVNKKFIELTTKGTEVKDFSAGKAADLAEVPERKVYRYRKWILDNKINVVVRSEADAYITEGDNTPFIKVCALNECMSQNDWKQNVELNRGALISSELRNNLCKICKWLCQAYLTECNTFKIGFVTKPNAKEPKYSILTVEDMSTTTLSNTQGFRMKDSWSIIKTVADVMSKYEDGVYSFVKLPYKQGIRIYQVPDKEENQES